MGHRLLSRQSSCPEATATHILHIPGWVFVFRQNGAPAHRASDTVAFPERKVLDSFLQQCSRQIHWILTQSTIYSICSVLQEKVYPSRIANLDELKTRLIDEWKRFHQSIVEAAIAEVRRYLGACDRLIWAHFEHQFQQVNKIQLFCHLPTKDY